MRVILNLSKCGLRPLRIEFQKWQKLKEKCSSRDKTYYTTLIAKAKLNLPKSKIKLQQMLTFSSCWLLLFIVFENLFTKALKATY